MTTRIDEAFFAGFFFGIGLSAFVAIALSLGG